MREVDRLVQEAVKSPKEVAVRTALADYLRADERPEMAFTVEDDETGPLLLETAKNESKKLKLPVSLELLWYVYAVLPRISVPNQWGQKWADVQPMWVGPTPPVTYTQPHTGGFVAEEIGEVKVSKSFLTKLADLKWGSAEDHQMAVEASLRALPGWDGQE